MHDYLDPGLYASDAIMNSPGMPAITRNALRPVTRIKESPMTIESHNLATGELVGTYAECDDAETNLRAFNVLGTTSR
jgi:hypothetical protein